MVVIVYGFDLGVDEDSNGRFVAVDESDLVRRQV